MDILFLNPPKSRKDGDQILDTSMLWMASQLSYLGCQVSIRMPSGDKLHEQIEAHLNELKPRIVAIACKWWNTLYGAIQVAQAVRRVDPKLKIIMGGHTATVFCKELVYSGVVDVILKGDVDQSLPILVCEGRVSNAYTVRGHIPSIAGVKKYPDLGTIPLTSPSVLLDAWDQIPGYVWTGRGCNYSCFYCAENRKTGRELLGRSGCHMRSVDEVASDILSLQGRGHIIFDYEHASVEKTSGFLEGLGEKISNNSLNCYHFAWGLPSKAMLDTLSEVFNQVSVCIDVQVFDEEHRRRLSSKSLVKPFFSDESLCELLDYAEQKDNICVDGTGIVGLPYETEGIRERGIQFIEAISKKYQCARDWRASPLHVIPGTPLAAGSKFHDLEVIRRDYDDFYSFTEEAYEDQVAYYSTVRKHHPYGVYPEGQPNAIVNFMSEATRRLESLRKEKVVIQMEKEDNVAKIELTDPFSPLRSLIELLSDGNFEGEEELHLHLGPHTWFHSSWIDYTSESGENSATMFGQRLTSVELEQKLKKLLARFPTVLLKSKHENWGIISDLVK